MKWGAEARTLSQVSKVTEGDYVDDDEDDKSDDK